MQVFFCIFKDCFLPKTHSTPYMACRQTIDKRGDVGGAAPKPLAGGLPPCTPFIGASPQEIKCLAGCPCLCLAFPFGAAPQNPTRAAWLRTRKACGAKGKAAACVPRPFILSKKNCKVGRHLPLFRSFISGKAAGASDIPREVSEGSQTLRLFIRPQRHVRWGRCFASAKLPCGISWPRAFRPTGER